MSENLSEELKDILNRPDFEWQEFVLEEPVKAAEIMQELFEYVRKELASDELEKANARAVRTGNHRDFHNWIKMWRNR